MATTELVKTTESYVIPTPDMIMTHDEVLRFIGELEAHPRAWVYILTKILSRPTPEDFLSWREGPQKLKLFYVDGAYAIATRAALSQLGIASDLKVLDTVVEGSESVSALVELTFKFVHDGQIFTVTSTQWGDCPRRTGMSWGDVRKGAVTDGLKKCLSEYGWAADVYGMTPEKMSLEETTPEDARLKSLEYVIQAATAKGISELEVRKYCIEHYGGKDLNDLDQVTLTSLRRKIQSKGVLE